METPSAANIYPKVNVFPQVKAIDVDTKKEVNYVVDSFGRYYISDEKGKKVGTDRNAKIAFLESSGYRDNNGNTVFQFDIVSIPKQVVQNYYKEFTDEVKTVEKDLAFFVVMKKSVYLESKFYNNITGKDRLDQIEREVFVLAHISTDHDHAFTFLNLGMLGYGDIVGNVFDNAIGYKIYDQNMDVNTRKQGVFISEEEERILNGSWAQMIMSGGGDNDELDW